MYLSDIPRMTWGLTLHVPTGLNITGGLAVLQASDDGRQAEGFIIRPGWRHKWFDVGETKVAADFLRSRDITIEGDKSTSIGAFVLQDIDSWGLQVYAGYRNYDLDRDDVGLDDIHVFTLGAAVNFGVDIYLDDNL